jgi:mannan endo-1,6-alpha-mannosidase
MIAMRRLYLLTQIDSVKETVGILSENLRQYYNGDREGSTPGLLPRPYYWWQCGAMFDERWKF